MQPHPTAIHADATLALLEHGRSALAAGLSQLTGLDVHVEVTIFRTTNPDTETRALLRAAARQGDWNWHHSNSINYVCAKNRGLVADCVTIYTTPRRPMTTLVRELIATLAGEVEQLDPPDDDAAPLGDLPAPAWNYLTTTPAPPAPDAHLEDAYDDRTDLAE